MSDKNSPHRIGVWRLSVQLSLGVWIGLSVRSPMLGQGNESPKFGLSATESPIQLATSDTQKASGQRPRRRTSGGSRDPGPDSNTCPDLLIAIVPGEGDVSLDPDSCGSDSFAAPSVTAMRSPTLWFHYAPRDNYPGLFGKFVLLKNNEPIHTSMHDISTMRGMFPIPIKYDLEPQTWYDWQFSVILDTNHPTENPMVESRLQYQPNPAGRFLQDRLHQAAQGFCLDQTDISIQQEWVGVLAAIDLLGVKTASWSTCDNSAVKVSRTVSN